MGEGHAVDPGENLSRSRDVPVGLRWPAAVGERLDQLVEEATALGEKTNRKELIAALIATADLTPDEVASRLKRYRTMTAGEILPLHIAQEGVVELRPRTPGPRRMR